jgi:hypothetical protein
MKRKMKRFDGEEGSQVFSEAQEKWLGGADRTDPYILARMRAAVPDEPKKTAPAPAAPKNEVIDMRDNSKNVISDDTRQRAMEYVKNQQTKPAPVVKPAAPKQVVKTENDGSNTPKYIASKNMAESNARDAEDKKKAKEAEKTSSTPVGENKEMVEKAYKDAAKMNAENETKDKKLSAADIAKIQRESISGKKDTDQKMPESKSRGKRFREFFGSDMKAGGTVKRSSASKRGDGIATKGHTRGKYC